MARRLKLGAILLGILILVGVIWWYVHGTPIAIFDPRGPIASQERRLIIIALLMSLIVVIPVFGLTILFAWRYREGNTSATYSPELDHNRLAETIWWVIPSALILVLSVIAWNSSHQLDPYKPLASSTPPLTIQVVALDWKWLFIYPAQNIASVNFLQFPKGTPLNFQLTADAPMNSFWIPQLGGQIYAMPGMSTQLHLEASSTGSFRGLSANISGQGFAGMDFVANATSQTDFNSWVASVRHSPLVLTQSQYTDLAAPSQNNRPTYYSSTLAGLYGSVIAKYLGPGGMSGMSGMTGAPATTAAGMEMQ